MLFSSIVLWEHSLLLFPVSVFFFFCSFTRFGVLEDAYVVCMIFFFFLKSYDWFMKVLDQQKILVHSPFEVIYLFGNLCLLQYLLIQNKRLNSSNAIKFKTWEVTKLATRALDSIDLTTSTVKKLLVKIRECPVQWTRIKIYRKWKYDVSKRQTGKGTICELFTKNCFL